MAASSKLLRLDLPDIPVPGVAALGGQVGSARGAVPRLAKLDFAPNPKHYGVKDRRSIFKLRTARPRRVDQSPRLLLGLSLQCELAQMLDPDFEE